MIKLHVIRNVIKEILAIKRSKDLLILLFFIVLSGGFWLAFALNDTYECVVDVPVCVVNIPGNVVFTTDSIDTVSITIADKGFVLLGYKYGKTLQSLMFEFRAYSRSDGNVTITSTEIQRLIGNRIATSSKISAVKPEKIEFYYNYGLRKRVPVRWVGSVVPDHIYFISDVLYNPDSVDVYASREALDTINVAYTDNIDYSGFRDSLHIRCKMQRVRGIKYVPDEVDITFYTDILTELEMNIPITCVNVPEGKRMHLFPSKVSVKFVSGVERYYKLNPEDFVIEADYAKIEDTSKDKCSIFLRQTPQEISHVKLEIDHVDYILEEE